VLSEVEKTCDRVAIVRDGQLMAVRTIAELSATLPRRVTIRFAPDKPLTLPPLPGAHVVSSEPDRVVLDVTGPLGPLIERLAGLPVADLDVRAPSLEDYVLGLYRGEPPSSGPPLARGLRTRPWRANS
jgi:ABC-2 type transport system ATP-binding protein